MSDWQVGDLALCVDDGGHRYEPLSSPLRNVRRGMIYTLSGVSVSPLYGETVLTFEGVVATDTKTGAYSTYRFRKILPDAHEACEAEFLTLLKRGKVKA